MTKMIVIWLAATFSVCSAYWAPDLPKGPFCGIDRRCCKNREDGCSHQILVSVNYTVVKDNNFFANILVDDSRIPFHSTLCYCDEFCNRTPDFDDCCPDYTSVCLNEQQPPESLVTLECYYKGKKHFVPNTWKDECNVCKCVNVTNTIAEAQCTQDVCLMNDTLAEYVNRMRIGWRATTYPQFSRRTLRDGLKYRLGTLPLRPETRHMVSVTYEPGALPRSFDAREQWPQYVTPVQDQGWCGSDWAVSTASVLADKFAIQSKGHLNEQLSAQSLLSCNTRGQKGCSGGHIDTAWQFASKHGLVSESCIPYEARTKACPFPLSYNATKLPCVNSYRSSRVYRSGPPSKLSTEKDIKYEIMKWGPVQAIITVYQDLFHYRAGVYRHIDYGDSSHGLHSVRVLGWGEEDGQKYWLIANSWGPEWGEAGYMRVVDDDSATSLEFVVTTLANVAEHNKRRR